MKENKYTHYDTERLNAVPFSQVAAWLADVKRKGSMYVTRCPWHEDTHPSLYLYERTNENRCHCFSCGNGGSVIDYVMKQQDVDFKTACEMLSNQFGISVSGESIKRSRRPVKLPEVKKKLEVKRKITYIPKEFMLSTLSDNSSLSRCLYKLFDSDMVKMVNEEYCIGYYEDDKICDGTIFWSIDRNGNVRNGKVQCYCDDVTSASFAHFDKTPGKLVWLGKRLAAQGIVPVDAEFDNKCLFGEHLLAKYPEAVVVLVESPKNAILGALECPQFLWVATGNKEMLTKDVLEPLRNRQVIVIPDRDAIGEWTDRLQELSFMANFQVSQMCEKCAPEMQKKYDIADWIIEKRMQQLQKKPF